MEILYDREKNDVRCVLLRTTIPLGEKGKYIEQFFKDKYDIDVEYLEGVKTVPGESKQNNRLDQIITVKAKSVEKFREIKSEVNAEYALDIVRRGDHRL